MPLTIDAFNELLSSIESEFRVEALIIESGQRQVYRGKRTATGENVIIKSCPLIPITVARIKREIKILSETDSIYFPRFYFDFFFTEEIIQYFIDNLDPKVEKDRIQRFRAMNLRPFFVTVEEYIEHVPWQSCVARLREEREMIEFLNHVFNGLEVLWGQKIVHRDLKPENILIRPDLRPVIIDLGIAKNLNDGATALTHPLVGSPCTPRFAGPEQLANNKSEITYKTDQFSVGVIVFLTLTNQFPYGNDSEIGVEGVIQNFMSGSIKNFRDFNKVTSDALVSFIYKLLQVQPYKRFRTADEIKATLTSIKESL